MVAADFDITVDDKRIMPPLFQQPPVNPVVQEPEYLATINLVAMRPTAVGERVVVRFKSMTVKEQVTIFYSDNPGTVVKFIQPHASIMNMKIEPTVVELR